MITHFIALLATIQWTVGQPTELSSEPLPTDIQLLKTDKSVIYSSDQLVIRKLSEHTYQHISYLQTESFGNVPCNGMIVLSKGEATVFDTPATNEASEELITFFVHKLNCTIKAVVATHFHEDCVGGLEVFHTHDIASYASERTLHLLKETGTTLLPEHTFEENMELTTGELSVDIGFFGEGHTPDNVVAYVEQDQVLFGGCLLKEDGAGKGYLGDANTKDWPETVERIKEHYPDLRIIIPGHGEAGGMELADYTIELFK